MNSATPSKTQERAARMPVAAVVDERVGANALVLVLVLISILVLIGTGSGYV